MNKDDKEDLEFLKLLSKSKILFFFAENHSSSAFEFLSELNKEVNLLTLYPDEDEKYLFESLLIFLKNKDLNIEQFYFLITFLLKIRFKKLINPMASVEALKLDDLHLIKTSISKVAFIASKKKKLYKNDVMFKSILLKNYTIFNEILKKCKDIYFYRYENYSSDDRFLSHLDEVSLFFDLIKFF